MADPWIVPTARGRAAAGIQTGPARDVVDYIAWMEHCVYVRGLCDSIETANAAFPAFKRSASAERGRRLIVEDTHA